ncbi:MAG: hypothetical protein P4L85_11965 [Paludisphaera borealis]|uniref:hypothetical protein n=1 Tax=Paludisphaera borealis TaxID=1387353 RepID=UPI0028498C47|nr:hypothetical protein [Paludisphaera borealis]MDR3620058.1 hypothetical protein [Paludisphaera borealis]
MNRWTRPSARDKARFAPVFEGLEGRLVLSSSSLLISGALRPAAARANAAGDVASFPLRFRPFTAMFQGNYTVGPARSPGFATQLYMAGGGTSSSFLHGDIQLAYYVPADASQPAVGMANMIVKNISDTGNQLGADFQAVPGAVDRAGRPNHFTWTVNSNSGGTFSGSEGSGTLQLIYYPSRKLPQGATAAGRIGVVFRGSVGTTDTGDITRNS